MCIAKYCNACSAQEYGAEGFQGVIDKALIRTFISIFFIVVKQSALFNLRNETINAYRFSFVFISSIDNIIILSLKLTVILNLMITVH